MHKLGDREVPHPRLASSSRGGGVRTARMVRRQLEMMVKSLID
jgi:hypothetical protein